MQISSPKSELDEFGCAFGGEVISRDTAARFARLVSLARQRLKPSAQYLHFNRTFADPDFHAMVHSIVEAALTSPAFRKIRYALGDEICVILNQCVFRIINDAQTSVPYHQDLNFMGPDYRVINCWIALNDCGDKLPGLEILKRRFRHNLHARASATQLKATGSGLYSMHYLGETIQDILGADDGTSVEQFGPNIGAGEAFLFDQYCLHRTQPMEGDFERVSAEIRVAALRDVLRGNLTGSDPQRCNDLILVTGDNNAIKKYHLQQF